MLTNKYAFTLIELLVVVLIIGILAAVALPQYQVAVTKSRFATLKNLAESLLKAEQLYYLANNQYASQLDALDIDMPGGKLATSTENHYDYNWGYCEATSIYIRYQNKQIGMFIQLYFDNTHKLCVAENTDLNSVQNKVCKQETNATQCHTDGDLCVWYGDSNANF